MRSSRLLEPSLADKLHEIESTDDSIAGEVLDSKPCRISISAACRRFGKETIPTIRWMEASPGAASP